MANLFDIKTGIPLVDAGLKFLGNNAGSIAGGIAGAAANSGSTTNTQTANKDPWGPAQPYMIQNLKDQAALQDYYRKTPFNAQQQAGYNNIFGDTDHFRDSVAPGLMGFANNAMGGSYDRQRGGLLGGSAGYGGEVRPGGRTDGSGPFSVNPNAQKFGLIDFAAANPYTNGAIPAPKPAATPGGTGDTDQGYPGGGGGFGSHGGGGDGTSGNGYTLGIGNLTDKINSDALDTGLNYGGLLGPVVGIIAGLVKMGYTTEQALAAINASDDPLGSLIRAQGWSSADIVSGIDHDPLGPQSGESVSSGGGRGGGGLSSTGANAGHGYGQGFGGQGWGGTTTG